MLDREHALPVVLYRLVDPVDGASAGPWGEGLLVKLARDEQYGGDNELRTAIVDLLEQPWSEDPNRTMLLRQSKAAGRARMRTRKRMSCASCSELPAPSAAEPEEAAPSAAPAPSSGAPSSEEPSPERRGSKAAEASSGTRHSFLGEEGGERLASIRKQGGRIGVMTALMGRNTKGKSGYKLDGEGHKSISTKDATWGHVLVHARGNVGETALHLCFLLNTEA